MNSLDPAQFRTGRLFPDPARAKGVSTRHLRDYHFFFAMAINSYNMLPLSVVQWMARILPWLELALGALLILGIALRWVSLAITLLLLVFMGALTRAAMLGLEINCGCFGYSSQKPTTELFHDSGLLILGLAVTIGAFLTQRARRLPVQTASPE